MTTRRGSRARRRRATSSSTSRGSTRASGGIPRSAISARWPSSGSGSPGAEWRPRPARDPLGRGFGKNRAPVEAQETTLAKGVAISYPPTGSPWDPNSNPLVSSTRLLRLLCRQQSGAPQPLNRSVYASGAGPPSSCGAAAGWPPARSDAPSLRLTRCAWAIDRTLQWVPSCGVVCSWAALMHRAFDQPIDYTRVICRGGCGSRTRFIPCLGESSISSPSGTRVGPRSRRRLR